MNNRSWAVFDGDGTRHLNAEQNVEQLVRTPPGTFTITWSKDFSSNDYVVVGTAENGRYLCVDSKTPGSISVRVLDVNGNQQADGASVLAFEN